MNPKKEFVKAIMSVLRLEQNIYTVASIEEIIDRIDVEDYTMFIAYLGEREYDYEKPIQTIAKAVDEYHEKKTSPILLATVHKAREAQKMISALLEIETQKRCGKSKDELYQEVQKYNVEATFSDDEKYRDYTYEWDEFKLKTAKIIFDKGDAYLSGVTLSKIETKEKQKIDIEALKTINITIEEVLNAAVDNDHLDIYKRATLVLCKPSIVEKIESRAKHEAGQLTGIEHKKVKSLVSKASRYATGERIWG